MKKNGDIVKKDLLRRKINEYFKVNPSAKMVIIRADVGGNKTHWRVTKEGKSFKIVEVNTVKEEFVLEAGTAILPKPPNRGTTSVRGQPMYDPDEKVTPGDLPLNRMPAWTAKVGQNDPNDPAKTAQQSMSQWDPNNPTGAFSRLVKSVGMQKAMLGMPDSELKKHFGLSKQALKSQGADPQKAKLAGLKAHGESKVNEATSPEFAKISTMFTKAMTPPFQHSLLSSTMKQLSSMIPVIKDPNERQQVGAMIGSLTSLVDATTAQGGGGTSIKIQGKEDSGSSIAESETDDRLKKKDSALREEQPPPPEEDDGGLDKEPPAPILQSPVKTHEDQIVNNSLAGQTIKSANVTFNNDGAALELELLSLKNPVRLEWTKSGKITFNFKGRPYFLKK